ncbi:MAG: hypothetical protein GY806_11510, partial [Gammaproteobacteria bacterium]|nr:hypothetical protein [Gammaproteobacteria bacterium]
MAVSNSSKAIELLSDERLDQLTAGASITPQYGQNLTQGEVGNIDVADTVSLEVNGIHHTTAGNEIIVSADSQAELLINRVLHLGDSAQVDIKALSISNAVASDLANAINASANHLDESSRLSQINNTSQAELNVASIGLSRWESGYRFDQQQSIHNSSSDSSSFLQESQRNFNHKHTERYNSVNVEIEKYDPRLLLGEIKVGTPNTEPFTLIPAYSGPCSTFAKSCAVPVGDIIDPFEIFGFIPDRVNYEHGWEQTTLELPEFNASLVSESLTKKDLVIRLTAEPPVIDLGAIYFNTQAVFDDEDTPRAIDVNSIDIPATDFPSINVDISAPNPLYGLEMSINSGFALAGQGEIKGDFGSINGLATVNVTNTLESIFPIQPVTDAIQGGIDLVNAIDFLDIFPDIPGPKDFDLDLVIDIPLQIDLNPDNLDLSHSGDVKVVESDHPFHFIYDGVFCFQLFGD